MTTPKGLQIVFLTVIVFLIILAPLALLLNAVAPGAFTGFWAGVFYLFLAGLCSAAVVAVLIRFSPGIILNKNSGGNRSIVKSIVGDQYITEEDVVNVRDEVLNHDFKRGK